MDRDEKSRHVVDLFLAPKYLKQTKRSTTYAVSTSVHLKRLAAARGKAPTLRGQGQALQDAWFEYLRDGAGLKVLRGAAKMRRGDDWQPPEELEAERVSDRFEAVFNERLFPEYEMELCPPTPEEEVILKRARKSLDEAAMKAAKNARREAEKAKQEAIKAKAQAAKVKREFELSLARIEDFIRLRTDDYSHSDFTNFFRRKLNHGNSIPTQDVAHRFLNNYRDTSPHGHFHQPY